MNEKKDVVLVSLKQAIGLKELNFCFPHYVSEPRRRYYEHNGEKICAPELDWIPELNWVVFWAKTMYGLRVQYTETAIGHKYSYWFVGDSFPSLLSFSRFGTLTLDMNRRVVDGIIEAIKRKTEAPKIERKKLKILKLERDMYKSLCENVD